jgi:hypothetical protein
LWVRMKELRHQAPWQQRNCWSVKSGSGEDTVTVIRQVQNLLLPCLVRQSEVFEGMSPYLCSFKTDNAGLRRLEHLESEPVFILHCFKQWHFRYARMQLTLYLHFSL